MAETTEKFVFDAGDAIKAVKALVGNLSSLQQALVKIGVTGLKSVAGLAKGIYRAAKGFADFSKRAWNAGAKIAHQFNSIKAAVSTVIGVVKDLGGAIFNAAQEGESLRVAQDTFKAIGRTKQDIDDLKASTKGLVPEAELVKAANLAEGFQIATDDLKVMSQIAVGASALTGESVEYMMQSITTGTARGSKMILDNLGVMVRSASVIEKEYAGKIGKSVDQLTDTEKKHALVMEIKARSAKQLAAAELVQGNNAQRAAVQITDTVNRLKVLVANGLESSGALDALGAAISSVGMFFEENSDVIGKFLGDAMGAVADIVPVIIDAFGGLIPGIQQIIPALRAVGGLLQALVPVIDILVTGLGLLLRGALIAVIAAMNGMLRAMRAVMQAVGMSTKHFDKAIKSMDKAIDSALGYEKASKKSAEAQARLTEKTKQATAAMLAQKQAEKIPESLGDAYGAVIEEMSGLTMQTDETRRLQEYYFDSVTSGGEDLVAVMQMVTDRSRDSTDAMVSALERTGLDIETKISILTRIEERAMFALDQVGEEGIRKATRIAGTEEAARAITVQTDAVMDALMKADEKRNKEKSKEHKKAVKDSKKRAEDLAQAERDAGLMLLSAVDRERVQLEEEYDTLIKALEGKNDQLVRGLTEARTKALEEFEKTQVEAKRKRFAERVEAIAGVGERMGAAFSEAGSALADPFIEAFDKVQARAEQNQTFMLASVQAIGNSASQLFLGFINQTGSFREQVFQNLGGLFSQLGTAFISWATAEGSLLAGNPFAAIGAAIALQTVGGLIASIGSRKPATGGGAGAGAAARRSFEDRKNREERQPMVVNLNYGFYAPDEIAGGVSKGAARGTALRGARDARRRGRAA